MDMQIFPQGLVRMSARRAAKIELQLKRLAAINAKRGES